VENINTSVEKVELFWKSCGSEKVKKKIAKLELQS